MRATTKSRYATVVDPAAVRRVTVRHYNWEPHYPHGVVPVTPRDNAEARLEFRAWSAHAAAFTGMRHLTLRGVQHLMDARAISALCGALVELEWLEFATVCDEGFVLASRAAVADPLLMPLTNLKRLHTLKFGATANVHRCHLPHLPQLLHFCAANARCADGDSAVTIPTALDAFPSLTTLHVHSECIDRHPVEAAAAALRDHCALRRLKLATRHPERGPYGDIPRTIAPDLVAGAILRLVAELRRYSNRVRTRSASTQSASTRSDSNMRSGNSVRSASTDIITAAAAAAAAAHTDPAPAPSPPPTQLTLELAWCRLPTRLLRWPALMGAAADVGGKRNGAIARAKCIEAPLGEVGGDGGGDGGARILVKCARHHRHKTACICSTLGGDSGDDGNPSFVCGIGDVLVRSPIFDCRCPTLDRTGRRNVALALLSLLLFFAAFLLRPTTTTVTATAISSLV
jgi:hypothetical protein